MIYAVQCHIAVVDTNCQQRILRIRFPYNIFFLSAAAATTTVIISAIIFLVGVVVVADISPLVIVQQKFLFLARRIVEKESSFQVEAVVLHGPNGQVEMGQHTQNGVNGVERRATYGISGLELILHILIIFVDEIFVVIFRIVIDLLKGVRCVVFEEGFRVETNGKVHFGWYVVCCC